MPSVPPWSAARRGVATPPWRAPVSPARRSPQPRACYRVMVAERGFVGLTTFGWRSRLGSPIPPCWLLTPEPQPAVALCRKQQRRVGLPHIVGIVELDPGVRPQVHQPREQLDSRQPRAEAGAGTGSERKVDGRVSQASRPQPAIRIEDLRLGPPPRIAMQQSKADHQPIARRERPLAQAGRAQDVSQQQPDRRMQAKCLLHHRGEVGKIAARGHLGLDAIAHLWPPGDFLDRPCGRDARAPERRWVWLLCRDWLTWEVVDLAGWVVTLPRGCRVDGSDGPRARGTGGGGTRRFGCGWTDYRAKSGPIQPGGSPRRRCLYRLSCVQRGVSRRQRCAGCRLRDPCRQDGGACRRLVRTEAVSSLRALWSSGTPTHRQPLVSQVRQSLQTSYTHRRSPPGSTTASPRPWCAAPPQRRPPR